MGKIRTKTVKRASRVIVEKYFNKLGKDYYVNKRVVMDVTLMASKKLRNKVSGYTTCIMKRLARGPVRGISLKLQEEERERRMDFVPEVSIVDQKINDGLVVDKKVMSMIKKMETGVPRNVRVETLQDRKAAAAEARNKRRAARQAQKK
eukprot:GILJ01006783.1.p2 GENE.GILJ01006783.1~~GILJ01006783.1.p2  ORF type:complete len:149 (-),score=44.68 GILJ01006783.1:48-494(-)